MTPDTLWARYQLGQVSSDHTDREVFCEVVAPLVHALERIANDGHNRYAADIAGEALKAQPWDAVPAPPKCACQQPEIEVRGYAVYCKKCGLDAP